MRLSFFVGVARVPGCLRISYDELLISHYAGAAYLDGEEMKVAVSVSGPPSGALHSIEQGHSAATLPRVIQHPGTSNPVADIDRLASSSCMQYESQADAHVQTNADSCAGMNNRDVRQLFLTQVSSMTKPSTRLRTEPYLTGA